MAIDLSTAEARLTAYMDAENAILSSQSYTIEVQGSRRTLTRANLKEVRDGITYWSGVVSRIKAGITGSRSRYLVR